LNTHLVVKDNHCSTATSVFGDTQVQITTEGKPHLGAALGTSPSFTKLYVKSKVDKWAEELSLLSSIAQTNPHVAYAGFTQGLARKWAYLTRTIETISPLLQPLEDII